MGDGDTVRAGLLLTQVVELALESLYLLVETVAHGLGVLVGRILKYKQEIYIIQQNI
jgi:hypothetical protein